MGFRERKAKRKAWYLKYVQGNKLKICTACNGSGYYDHSFNGRTPKCGSCNGTGKEAEREYISFSYHMAV